MFCDAKVVTISLVAAGAGAGSARLTIESDALRGATPCDPQRFERFDRIVTGLSRQPRSTIQRATASAPDALEIALFDRTSHAGFRPEERRVGKECVSTRRCRGTPYH